MDGPSLLLNLEGKVLDELGYIRSIDVEAYAMPCGGGEEFLDPTHVLVLKGSMRDRAAEVVVAPKKGKSIWRHNLLEPLMKAKYNKPCALERSILCATKESHEGKSKYFSFPKFSMGEMGASSSTPFYGGMFCDDHSWG